MSLNWLLQVLDEKLVRSWQLAVHNNCEPRTANCELRKVMNNVATTGNGDRLGRGDVRPDAALADRGQAAGDCQPDRRGGGGRDGLGAEYEQRRSLVVLRYRLKSWQARDLLARIL